MRRVCVVIVVIGLLGCSANLALAGFDGSLTYDDGGLTANGHWADSATSLSWSVNETPEGLWNYSYALNVPRHAVSHLILETSVGLPAGEITNVDGSFVDGECWSVGWFTPEDGNSNIGMPEAVYGVKFELGGEHTDLWFSFDCPRVPEWGDFYAKNGIGGGEPSTLWNAGFGMDDPDTAVRSGSVFHHVVRPDTTYSAQPENETPEPATWVLLAFSGIAAAARRRRTNG